MKKLQEQIKSKNYKYNQYDDVYHGLDVNVAIASTITAGARLTMSKFKNNSLTNLYYTDTDSIVVNRPLNNDFVGNNRSYPHLMII